MANIQDTEAAKERQTRKQARRDAQRLTNIMRAQKMHMARLEYEKGPAASVPAQKHAGKSHYHVGCSGWFYWHWKGLFYPAELPTSQWFNHYQKSFRTVELNAPFYGWPTVANVKSWLAQAGDASFLYTIKVSELITHIKRLVGTKTLIKDFGYIADLLGSHMGCFLYQFPPSHHYSPARLKAIVSQLDPQRRNVVEFRHASWWREEVYEAFRAHKIIFCSCSAPKLPDVLIKTADDIYVRFHGLKGWYRHDYSKEELAEWATRIKASKATHNWIYFNNDRDGHAISNARELLRLLKR